MGARSKTEEQMRDAVDGLKKLSEQIERLRKILEPLREITGPTKFSEGERHDDDVDRAAEQVRESTGGDAGG
jgi:hypothetical protein